MPLLEKPGEVRAVDEVPKARKDELAVAEE